MPASAVRTVLLVLILAPLALLALMFLVGNLATWPPRPYQGPLSDHFDGKKFFNPRPGPARGLGSVWKMMRERRLKAWVDRPALPEPSLSKRLKPGQCRVTLVNHATVLIQIDGFNILTDPIWSLRPSPVSWAGPRRHEAPGISFEDLPPIDAVVISHNHYDHMDLPTLGRIQEKHRPWFILPLGNKQYLESLGPLRVRELDWWQKTEPLPGLKIWAVPAQHFSGRGLWDRDRGLWAGYVIQTRAGSVYFAGDTAFAGHYQEIHKKFPRLVLACLPMGAYAPRWFMGPVHMNPAEAVAAAKILGARHNLAMHFGTFALGQDGQDQPMDDLKKALKEAGVKPDRIWVTANGGSFRVK